MGGSTESNTVPKHLKKLEALYEKLERNPNLEKAFLTDKKKFLEELELQKMRLMLLNKNHMKIEEDKTIMNIITGFIRGN